MLDEKSVKTYTSTQKISSLISCIQFKCLCKEESVYVLGAMKDL